MYPLNWPFAMELGALGIPLYIKVEIVYDDEEKVYVATSPNLNGLVVEAASLDETKKEVENCVYDLLEFKYGQRQREKNQTYLRFNASSQLKHA